MGRDSRIENSRSNGAAVKSIISICLTLFAAALAESLRAVTPAATVVVARAATGEVGSQDTALPRDDRIRIAEARRLAREVGDRVWPGWDASPFAVLLVTKQREFLVYHPTPSSDFTHLGYDSLLQSDVYHRERTFEPSLLATFPAVGGVPTIVIGQPRNTEASHSTRWIVTLLHEHFHQWQMSRPDYYSSVDSLGLAGGDSTGMWMLNYAFPYDDKEVGAVFEELCRHLRSAVMTVGTHVYREQVEQYWQARARFKAMLSPQDYAYFSFQVWQEGVARYTEYLVASMAEFSYRPTRDFENLPDRISFGADAERTREHILTELLRMSLKKSRRSAFYHVGAAEALLLDKENPGWRARYFADRFYTEKYFAKRPSPRGDEVDGEK